MFPVKWIRTLFSMSLNQFMNNLVCTLRISIYRNTLINFVVFFCLFGVVVVAATTTKIEFPLPCRHPQTIQFHEKWREWFINHWSFILSATSKTKNKLHWWKLCTLSLFGFIVWSKHATEIERGQSVLTSTAKYA